MKAPPSTARYQRMFTFNTNKHERGASGMTWGYKDPEAEKKTHTTPALLD